MGPSASNAGSPGISAERADQLLCALTTLRDLMVDPAVQHSLPTIVAEVKSLVPGLSEPPSSVAAAEAGLPAPANPGKGKDSKDPPKEAPPKEVKTEKPDEAEENPSADGLPEVVNSSTHRSEHARLVRKMASLDSTKYPEMSRLWAGGRKETCFCFTLCLEQCSCCFFRIRVLNDSQPSLRRRRASFCVTGCCRERTLKLLSQRLSSVASTTRKWNAARNC